MTAAERLKAVSVEEYLAGERTAKRKHEYVAGRVFARAGGTNARNLIASNALGSLVASLRGQRCRAYNSGTKVRIPADEKTFFYYPDAMVVCESNPAGDTFQDSPVLIIEVLSKSTRRTDDGEKQAAYLSIPSLRAYLLAEQSEPVVKAYRRQDSGVTTEIFTGIDAVIPLPEVNSQLALSDLYEGVEFQPEPEED